MFCPRSCRRRHQKCPRFHQNYHLEVINCLAVQTVLWSRKKEEKMKNNWWFFIIFVPKQLLLYRLLNLLPFHCSTFAIIIATDKIINISYSIFHSDWILELNINDIYSFRNLNWLLSYKIEFLKRRQKITDLPVVMAPSHNWTGEVIWLRLAEFNEWM